MSVSVIVAMSSQINVVCFFGQVLTEFVSPLAVSDLFGCCRLEKIYLFLQAKTFSQSIYQLDWCDLEIGEQKMLLLMSIRSQGAISMKAGHLYELNFPIITKVGGCLSLFLF